MANLTVGTWPNSGFRVDLPESVHRNPIYALGISGCLHPDTPIFDPTDCTTKTVYERFVEARPFHVASLNEANEPVIAMAQPPQQYPVAKMYRVVLSSGEEFVVTGQHRLFVGRSYVTVDALSAVLQRGGEAHLPSISGNDLLASFSDAHHWKRILVDFRDGYQLCRRLYGQRLQSEADADLASAPLPTGVRQRDCDWFYGDSQESRRRYTPSLCADHFSRPDCVLQKTAQIWSEGECQPSVVGWRQSDIYRQQSWQPALVLDHSDRDGCTHQSLPGSIDVSGYQLRLVSDICSELLYSGRINQLILPVYDLPYTGQYRAELVENEDREVLAYKEIYTNGITGTNQCQIISIEPAGESVYYDFHVPFYENYWACGVFHHNSGKSVLLGNLALQWSDMGEGVLLIDVKDGQLAKDVAMRADVKKLILVSPGSCYFDGKPHHWGLNILELPDRNRQTVSEVVDNVMSMLERLDRADYTVMTTLRAFLDSAVRLALYEPKPNLKLARELLTNKELRKETIERHQGHLNDEVLDHFTRFDNPSDNSGYGRNQQITSTVNRLKELLTPPELAFMLIQERSTIRLAEWLEAGKLVVVDCATGMSNRNAELLGNLILTQAMHFTFTRKLTDDSRYVRLIADEFDLLAGNNFARLITKARSYRVFPVMAHQNRDQLKVGRDAAQTLFNAASGVPVEFQLTLTDEDRFQAERRGGGEYIAQYKARLKLRQGSLPYGLLDAGQSVEIALQDWIRPPNEAVYQAALEAQRQYVTAERDLKSATMKGNHADKSTTTATKENPPRPGKGKSRSKKLQPDPAGASGAGSPEPVSRPDRPATRPVIVPGGTLFQRHDEDD